MGIKAKIISEIRKRSEQCLIPKPSADALIGWIECLPDEPEPIVRWCVYFDGEPAYMYSQYWDENDKIKQTDVRKVEIREVKNDTYRQIQSAEGNRTD